MVQFDGLRPARLKVGIISAGRVGTALGVALERADHVVVACSAISHASRQRAAASAARHPGAARPGRRRQRRAAAAGRAGHRTRRAGVRAWPPPSAVRPGTIVAHTSGANGIGVLAPLSTQDCIPLAIHPAMTFTGSDEDIARLPDTCFGITAADEVGYAIAQSLVLEIGGEPFWVARGRPHAVPRRSGPRRQPHRHGARRCARGAAGRAARAASCSANSLSTTSRAASPNASSDRWPGPRWRTPCNAARRR